MTEGCKACGFGLLPKEYKKFEELQHEQGSTIPMQYCFCANGQRLAKEGRLRNLLTGEKSNQYTVPDDVDYKDAEDKVRDWLDLGVI
jgi:hypothetical protein